MKTKFIYRDIHFYKTVAVMAIPIVLQNLITIGVNLIDTAMIGRLGETQLAASSLATQFVSVFQTFCMGLSMGASVLSSRFWGMQDIPSMRKTITIMFRICLVLASIFTAASLFFPEQIMRIYTDEEQVIHYGVKYLRFAAWAFFFHGLSLNCTIILRCVRKVKIPLFASIVIFFFNVGGNYVLIFGKFGFPEMGIAGASLATLIARFVEFSLIFGYFVFIDKSVGYRLKHLFISVKSQLPEYIKVSLPVLASDGLLAIGESAISMIIGRMGESFIAANAVVAVVTRLLTTFSGGISQASAVIVGNNLGEGRVKEVREQGYAFFGLGLFLGVIASCMVLLAIAPVIKIYEMTPATAAIFRQLMSAIAIVVIFDCANSITTKGVLRGGGDTKALVVGDCIFLWCASIPLGYTAGLVLGLPPFLVYACLKIDAILKCCWGFWRLRSGKWIKRISKNETAIEKT